MRNVFLVSSTIETTHGVFSPEQRLNQTVSTISSIRKNVPNSYIILYDTSVAFYEKNIAILSPLIDELVLLQNNKMMMELSGRHLKSSGECFATFVVLSYLKEKQQELLNTTNRIFKISGRYQVQDSFNIDEYQNLKGKYVFRKRIKSWLSEEVQKNRQVDHLFVTRFYSFCTTLVDDYLSILPKILDDTFLGLDLEHCTYKNINKDLVVEFDKVHCTGQVAFNGTVETD
jgi:predicted lipase